MTTVDEQGRPEPPLTANEIDTLRGFLDYQRATFEWKCAGLDAAELRTSVAASSMTLGGMMKHLSLVEESWFGDQLMDRDSLSPWNAVDWDDDPNWELRTAEDNSPDALLAQWQKSIAYANSMIDQALGEGGADQLARRKWLDGRAPSLRWIFCHMIEEYARHNGHADLNREAVDGESGE